MSMEDNFKGTPYGGTSGEVERIRPERQAGLDLEDISNKDKGNYILSFGLPGSGKTTFQWFLMNYLMNEGAFYPKIDVPDGANGPDWEGRRIINQWKEQWISGHFPEPTRSSESDIREVHVHVDTTAGKKLSLDFSFLEISGELLKLTMPYRDHDPHLIPSLETYFNNPKLKFIMMLMLHPDVEDNDKLFPSFISYIDREFPKLRERMSLGIIISKPEESLRRLNEFGSTSGKSAFRKFDEEALLAYFNRFCGETYQIWDTWPNQKRTLLSPLYLGKTIEKSGEKLLHVPDFYHIEQIFFWVFEQFTGQRPGPTFWQRLRGQVNWK